MEPETLPDTPKWSLWRKSVVTGVLLVGAAMILKGARAGVDQTIALRLIDNGSDILIWAAAIIIGGAASERAAAWVTRKTKGPDA
jgi:hypothetical protein